MTNQYDEDYYLNGVKSGKSLYSDYRWLPSLTLPMVQRMIDFLGINKNGGIQDFGCARGYLVKAFRELGVNAVGYDISEWAISNCDPSVRDFVVLSPSLLYKSDWVIAKDVLEHLNIYDVATTLKSFSEKALVGVFVVVPLSTGISESYVVPEYEKDITHVIRWPLWRWVSEFHSAFDENWEISARYRVEGIKDNYAGWPRGNGFITARRLSPASLIASTGKPETAAPSFCPSSVS